MSLWDRLRGRGNQNSSPDESLVVREPSSAERQQGQKPGFPPPQGQAAQPPPPPQGPPPGYSDPPPYSDPGAGQSYQGQDIRTTRVSTTTSSSYSSSGDVRIPGWVKGLILWPVAIFTAIAVLAHFWARDQEEERRSRNSPKVGDTGSEYTEPRLPGAPVSPENTYVEELEVGALSRPSSFAAPISEVEAPVVTPTDITMPALSIGLSLR